MKIIVRDKENIYNSWKNKKKPADFSAGLKFNNSNS